MHKKRIMKTQPEPESNPNTTQKRPTISKFLFNFFKESTQKA